MGHEKTPKKTRPYDEALEARFLEEAQRFKLYYTCDNCMHFNRKEERCMDFYPTEELRTPDHPVRLGIKSWLFCKCFEMH